MSSAPHVNNPKAELETYIVRDLAGVRTASEEDDAFFCRRRRQATQRHTILYANPFPRYATTDIHKMLHINSLP